MDRLYQQAVEGARQRAEAGSSEGSGALAGSKRSAADRGGAEGDKRPKKEKHGGGSAADKNVPAHRGAFKKHLRKHTLLFQREGGERARAFLITCDQGKEARCIQSGAELLKLGLRALRRDKEDGKADEDCAPPSDSSGGEETWAVDPGCNGLACITIEKRGVDPVDVLAALWDHVDELGKQQQIKSFYHQHKHCYRFIPLQHFCRAEAAEIESTVKGLLPLHFDATKPCMFSVMCDVRSCSSVKKMDLIHAVAGLVGKEHKVQLYMPDTLIVIQVIKAACGISILSNPHRYLKSQKSTFNLMIHAETLVKESGVDAKDTSVEKTTGDKETAGQEIKGLGIAAKGASSSEDGEAGAATATGGGGGSSG